MHASNVANGNGLYVLHSPKHLILALRATLQQLESTVPGEADRMNFAELERILRQRIAELEQTAKDGLASLPLVKPKRDSD